MPRRVGPRLLDQIHLTEKPVELAVRAIKNSSLQGENVLDLFGGSGSTLIACEQTGRKASPNPPRWPCWPWAD